jgi:hypothetical protein
VDEDVQRRRIVGGVVRAEDEALGSGDRGTAGREARDAPAVLRVLFRPLGEYLPRADRVKFLDSVEEEESDMTLLTAAGAEPVSGC